MALFIVEFRVRIHFVSVIFGRDFLRHESHCRWRIHHIVLMLIRNGRKILSQRFIKLLLLPNHLSLIPISRIILNIWIKHLQARTRLKHVHIQLLHCLMLISLLYCQVHLLLEAFLHQIGTETLRQNIVSRHYRKLDVIVVLARITLVFPALSLLRLLFFLTGTQLVFVFRGYLIGGSCLVHRLLVVEPSSGRLIFRWRSGLLAIFHSDSLKVQIDGGVQVQVQVDVGHSGLLRLSLWLFLVFILSGSLLFRILPLRQARSFSISLIIRINKLGWIGCVATLSTSGWGVCSNYVL